MKSRICLFLASIFVAAGCDSTQENPLMDGNIDAGNAAMSDAGNITMPDAGAVSACPELGSALLPGAAPYSRGDSAFAYDSTCQRVYMFFGDKAVPQLCNFPPSEFINEGWFFDLNTNAWSKITPEGAAPMERARPSGAWDSKRNQFLVFGGRFRNGTRGAYTFMNDLWAYSPEKNQWTELSYQGDASAPLGRMNTEMIYDADNDRVIIYGGGQLTSNFSSFIPYGDLHTFDLNTYTWTKIQPANAAPPARLFHSAALDSKRQRLYIFGGGGASAFQGPFYNDMWYFDFASNSWTEIPVDGGFPAQRIKGVFVYDAPRDQIVLMGGHDDTALGNKADVWSFDLEQQVWNLQIAGDEFNQSPSDFCDPPADFATYDPDSPERRASHVFEGIGDKAFLYGGRTDCGVANDSWTLDLSSFDWEPLNESISGMTCYRSGRTNCGDPGSKMCG